MSENAMMENVYTKLQHIQSELKVPKGQTNKFGGYNYRSCEDILEAVKPFLEKYSVVLTICDSLEMCGEWHYIKAIATLTDTEKGGSISNTAYAREAADKKGMDVSQITGAASSYARKYALNGLFCIDDTKDADATNAGETTYSTSRNNGNNAHAICSKCKKKISGIKKSDGTLLQPEQVAALTNGLCYKCYMAAQQAAQDAAKTVNINDL